MDGKWDNTSDVKNRYLYNGKEFEEFNGLKWSDYGARWYMPELGRFTGVDPISDQFPHVSVYNYAENEPIGNIDLWGLQKWNAKDGNVINGPYRNQGEANKASRAAQGVSSHLAYTGIRSEVVRKQYQSTVSKLDKTNTQGRTQAKVDARSKTPAITKTIAENMRPMSEEGTRVGGTANKTNAGVNDAAAKLGKAGKVMGAASVGFAAYNIATAEDKGQAVATEVGSFAGAIAGGEAGATIGAGVGVWFGGAGAIPGAVVGGIIGSAVGAITGAEVGKQTYKAVTKPNDDNK